MGELGAETFYGCADCDEVDGLEEAIDRWVGGLWTPLRQALAAKTNSPQVTACFLASSPFLPQSSPCKCASYAAISTWSGCLIQMYLPF